MKLAVLIFGAGFALAGLGANNPLVANGGFEQVSDGNTDGWRTISPHYVYRDGEGRSGTRALCFENSDPTFYSFPTQKIPLKPGRAYEYEVWVRTENLVGNESGASVCIEWNGKNGRWLGGSYATGVKGTKDWTRIVGITEVIPHEATDCRICPYVRKGMTGKAWFDDVAVREVRVEPLKGLYSSAYRNQAAAGEVTFRALIGLPPEECGPDLSLRFTYQDAAGKSVCVSPTNSYAIWVTIPVASLKLGEQLVKGELFKANTCIGTQTCRFTRLAQLPERATWFDEYGRTIHQGKPFFPLGMYWGSVTTNHVETFAKGPFNCLMPYASPNSRDLMDLCAAKGLKVIYSVKDVYSGTRWAPKGIETPADEERYIRDRVARFKDHPALLAWYLNDELPLTMKDRLSARRDLMEKLDPSHPGWVVLYQWTQIADYLPTFDVIGTDPYPIPDRPAVVASEWTRSTVRAACVGNKPVWQVPQAFNWGAYRKENAAKCRAPTEAELRSMCWQCIANGANGLVLYSFFDLYKQPNGEPFEKRWAECCRVGAEIREHFPILLAEPVKRRGVIGGLGYASPSPNWKGPKHAASMRAWEKDGDVYVLVVNGFDEEKSLSTTLFDSSFTRVARVMGPEPRLMPVKSSEVRAFVTVPLAPLEPAIFRLSR